MFINLLARRPTTCDADSVLHGRAAIRRLHKARGPGPLVRPGHVRRRHGSAAGADAAGATDAATGRLAGSAAVEALGHDRDAGVGSWVSAPSVDARMHPQ